MDLLDIMAEGIASMPINIPGLNTAYRSAKLAKVEMLGAHIRKLQLPVSR